MSTNFSTQSITTPVMPANTTTIDRPKIRLRGSIYVYSPRPIVTTEDKGIEGATVTLIYRGNTYERKLQFPKPYQQPRALNWRWQNLHPC
jgi:hypothetical protein